MMITKQTGKLQPEHLLFLHFLKHGMEPISICVDVIFALYNVIPYTMRQAQ